MTVTDGFKVQSTASYVELRAGDDLLIETGATDALDGKVGRWRSEARLYGADGNADAGVGSTITVAGTVTAPRVHIRGSSALDTIVISGNIVASEFIEIYGGGGNDTITRTGTLSATEIRYYGEGGNDVITIDIDELHPKGRCSG